MSVNLRVFMQRSLHSNYSTVFRSHHKDRLQRTYFESFFFQGCNKDSSCLTVLLSHFFPT